MKSKGQAVSNNLPLSASSAAEDGLSRVLKQGGWYALGNILVKASGLLLAPIYLNPAYLSTQAFGYFALLMVTAQLGICSVGLGLGRGLLKFFLDPAYEHRKQALLFTALVSCTAAAGLGVALFWALSGSLAHLLLDDGRRKPLILLLALYVACKVIGDIPLITIRAKEKAGVFTAILAGEAAILILAACYLVAVRHWGLTGLMAAYAISAGCSTATLLAVTLSRMPWRYELGLLRPMLRLGSPLIVAGLAAWVLNFSDRYLLKWLIDAKTTGLYEWAARLAGTINMLFVQSFQFAFAVIGLKALGSKSVDGSQLHRETFRHYVIWTGWAVLGLTLFAPDLTRLLSTNPYYLQADPLVLWLGLGFMAYGIHYILTNILYAAEKAYLMSAIVVAAALLNVLLNLLLIRRLGAIGAALATYLCYLILALENAYFVRRNMQMTFPWSMYAGVVGVIVSLYLVGRIGTQMSLVMRCLVKSGLAIAYLPLVVALRLYTWQEITRVCSSMGVKWIKKSD